MSEDKLTVTWDEIKKQDMPAAADISTASAEQGIAGPSRKQSRGLLLVACILGALGLLVAAGVGARFVLFRNSPHANAGIEKVLKEDAACSRGATSAAEVVAKMRKIDTSACPRDFRSAYLAHVHAWELMAGVEADAKAFKSKNDPADVFVESLIRSFLGDPLGKAHEIRDEHNQLQKRYKEATQQVQATFHRVEDIAVAQGAALPTK